jgi:hypothetical protein
MNLRARLNRLAAHRGSQDTPPDVTRIIFNAARRENGEIVAEAVSAMVWTPDGWKNIIREDGETEADYIERIDRMDS